MKKLLIACGILLGSLASAGGIGNLPETVRHFSDGMRNILPDAADVIPNGRGRYTVRNAKQQTIGTLFLEQIADDERQMGYAGTIEIALLFDRDGKVAGVLIGKNQETVSFLNRVRAARFLERWNGLRMEEIPGREIDAVSGATYSSSAIRTGVRKLAESYLADRKDSASAPSSPPAEPERTALQRELLQLERKVSMHRKILAGSERLLEQLRTRKEEELRLGFLAAAEGKAAAQEFARKNRMIYFSHPRRANSGKSRLEQLGEQYRRTKSETDRANLQKAVLAEYERKLRAIPPHNREHEKALNASLARIAVLKKKLEAVPAREEVIPKFPVSQDRKRKLRKMAEEYRASRNPALLAEIRKEAARQLAAGIAELSAKIATAEREAETWKQQLSLLLDDPDDLLRRQIRTLTGNE